MTTVRPPAVAGMFYPLAASALNDMVAGLLREAADLGTATAGPVPKALVVPHAGYIYSGSTAALGYARVAPSRGKVTRVILLGPTHRVAVDGIALPGADVFTTPLGPVRIVSGAALATLQGLPQVCVSPAAHAEEHSLEVHLPFLQRTLGDVEVLPLAVGRATPAQVAEVIDALWGGPETLIVVSSDLSHYLPYAHAQQVDGDTVGRLLALDGPITHDQACGATPVNGLLVAAARHRLVPELLGMCTSGDTAGDRRRVVGYASIAFLEPSDD